MSWVIEEILTSSVGFIIAMVILTAVVAGGLYGYWVYANHVTLENYLWPIAEVLPYKGEYFLAVVNTGHEPFYVEQIYLRGGAVITPGQAANPGLGWCSVANTKLMHNQWWCGMVNQLPVAVRVCSALDPKVCIVAPVHGWETVTFSQATFGVGSGLIEVVVNDPYNAGWSVSWTYPGLSTSPSPYPWFNTAPSYSMSGSSSKVWFINPPYVPIQISFKASITQNPTGYKCQINPTSVTATYSGGSVQEFTVTCTSAADIVIEDYYYGSFNQYGYYVCGDPVKYTINYWGNATGTLSGQVPCIGWNSKYNITYAIPTNGTIYWKLTSVSIPSDTTCIIDPQSGSVNPGQVATIIFSCIYMPSSGSSNYWVYVSVTGDSYGAGWKIASSAGSITGTGNVNDEQLYIGGPSDTLTASITSNPSGYTCTISPSSESVISGYHYTFTVSCQSTGGSPPPPPPGGNNYFVYVTVTNDTLGAGWQVSSSVASISGTGNTNSPQQLKIGGQTDTLTAQITSNPSGYTCTISPGSTQATNGSTYTFTVSCVQSSQPPQQPCTVEPPSVSSSPSGAPQPTSSASVSSIPYGQSESVTFYYNAPLSDNNYVFQYWSIGGQTYRNNVVNITETLTCTTPGQTLTGPSGTAYYQYQPPGSISIDPDWIDLTQSSETYTFSWTSDWSGTGTFTWSISGLVIIYYNETPSGLVTWNGKVSLPDGTVAAQGSGYLKITNYPTPPDPFHYYECGVGGSGTVNGVSASGDSVKETVSISCTLESIFG
jgi:hypothetical protein